MTIMNFLHDSMITQTQIKLFEHKILNQMFAAMATLKTKEQLFLPHNHDNM